MVIIKDKEYLQLKVKVLNELTSKIRKALKMNEFQQVNCLVKRFVWKFPRI